MFVPALLLLRAAAVPGAQVDTFGSAEFLPTLEGSRSWSSAHWANGKSRTVKYASDPWDPTDWTEDHSGGTDGFWIDGAGTLRMSGDSPRFHLNSLRTSGSGPQFFRNTEFTAYFRHSGTAGQAYGGLVVGARGGPLGHASSGGDDCDATTYYARFRNDGKWDFEKELKHPTSDYWSGSGFHTQDPLWRGSPLPRKRWIGIKYLVWSLPDGKGVHLESWIDSISEGEPARAAWIRVGTVDDTGQWAAAPSPIQGCSYTSPSTVIEPGHGTFLLRTDGDTAEYRLVTLREIVPPEATSARPRIRTRPVQGVRLKVLPDRIGGDASSLRAIDASGRSRPAWTAPPRRAAGNPEAP